MPDNNKNILKSNNIYDFTVKDGDGNDVSLADYKDKVLLIVNTATECGFTPQYQGLQTLYDKFNSRGFEILDFPCNQFGHQAPGTNKELASFCQINYGVKFKTFGKIDVNGKNADPLYVFLKKQKHGIIGSSIKWNFTKFLIDSKGSVANRFNSNVEPEAISRYIEELLAKKETS